MLGAIVQLNENPGSGPILIVRGIVRQGFIRSRGTSGTKPLLPFNVVTSRSFPGPLYARHDEIRGIGIATPSSF